jgi:uncharacterized membrane protein
MRKRYFLLCSALLLAAVVAAILCYPHVPARVPIHWDLQGNANGYGPPWSIFLVGPGTMALTIGIFALLPWLSPRRFEVEPFLATYLHIMLLLVVLLGYLFAVILVGTLATPVDVGRAAIGGVAVLIAFMGNVLGKVKRNFFIGIRTPWTLASERVWHATHRLAGRLMVVTGLAGLLVVVAGAPSAVVVGLLVAGPLVAALYSLVYYKQLAGRGELETR